MITIEAGIEACIKGQADWCAGCDTTRYRSNMRWLHGDLYRCLGCLGSDAVMSTSAVPDTPEVSELIRAFVPQPPKGGAGVVLPHQRKMQDWGSSEPVRG